MSGNGGGLRNLYQFRLERDGRWLLAVDIALAAWAGLLILLIIAALLNSTLDGGLGDGETEPRPPDPALLYDLTLDYVTVRPEDRAIEAILTIRLQQNWVKSLRWTDGGTPVFDCEQQCEPSRPLDNAAVVFSWRLPGGEPLGTKMIELEELATRVRTLSAPVTLPAVGTPLHFPDDNYRSNTFFVELEFRGGVSSDLDSAPHPIYLGPDRAAGYGDYTATVVHVGGVKPGDEVTVDRKARVRLLVYAVAAAPALLIAAASRQWYVARRRGGTVGVAGIELAGALLAILPLREALGVC